MYSTLSFWLTALACLVAGAIAGWFVRRALDPTEQRIRDLERRLADADTALANYRREVTSHFRGTAERVNRLTEDYRELHTHLAEGALGLCDSSAAGESAPLLTSLSGTRASAPLGPPLDYAPPRTAVTPGQRAEDFDLERIHDA